jgi:hypothetical protein
MNGFTPSQGETLPILDLVHPAIGDFATFFSPSNNGVVNIQPFNAPGGLMVEDLPAGQSVSVTSTNLPQWQPEGPAAIWYAQSDANPDNGQAGAIASVLVTPDGVVYLGTVNGGVWSYNPADDSGNTMSSWVQAFQDHHPFVPANFWVPLTDSQPSLAVSTMALDPNDPNNTLWVGTGSLSSYGGGGGLAVGILKTTDGGNNWVDLAGSAGATITGASYASPIVITTSNTSNLINGSSVTIRGVGGNTAANGNWTVTNVTATGFSLVGSVGDGTFTTSPNANPVWTSSINGDTILSLVPTKTTDPVTGEQVVLVGTYGQGIFRSTDGGANFASVNFYLNTGVSLASFNANNAFTSVNGDVVTSLVPDPTNPDYFYAAVSGIGIFESYNDGADWFEIDNSVSQITNNTYYQLAASPNPDGNTNLYVATAAIATTTTWGATYTGLLMAQISPIPLAPISWIPVSEVLSITHLVGSAVGSPGHS